MAAKERDIIDPAGNRVGVVLGIAEYEELLTELEELREREEMRHHDPARDPDNGSSMKRDLVAELLKEEAEYKAGRVKGQPWEEVKRELGLTSDV